MGLNIILSHFCQSFPGGSDGKASACNVGDPGSIPGLVRSPGEGKDNPLQYPCLENPMDRGAWWATVHGIPKSWTRLSNFTFVREDQPPTVGRVCITNKIALQTLQIQGQSLQRPVFRQTDTTCADPLPWETQLSDDIIL